MNADMVNLLYVAFILFGGCFAWVLSAGQLVLEEKDLNNYILSIFFFLTGIWQNIGGIVFLGITDDFGFNIYSISVPCFFLSIPFIFFYFQCIIKVGFTYKPSHLVHLIPPLLSFLILAPYGFSVKTDLYAAMNLFGKENLHFDEVVTSVVMYASMSIYLGYLLRLLHDIIRLRNQAEREGKARLNIVTSFIITLLLVNLFWFTDRLWSLGRSEVSYICVTMTLVTIHLVSIRHPEFLLIIKEEAERISYARSQIKKLDSERVFGLLNKKMDEDKLYRDENLTLKKLAEDVDVTPHQLSEILNTRLKKNFFAFVNSYRINEAIDMLTGEPDRKVIGIAYDVGFNSPSAFYNAFKKVTGMTPTEFRARNAR